MPSPGVYAVAVSGGVDSMVLLDVLTANPELRLVVAHLDHGIREDSQADRLLVQDEARRRQLPFVYEEAGLGAFTSEAEARKARYRFLRKVRQAAGASAIITAHHQDDVLETAVINILRGTNRKGLTALASTPSVLRPLLMVSKKELIKYAKDKNLPWHEDSTNQNDEYLRNYVRNRLLPRFSETDRKQMIDLIHSTRKTNQELDTLLVNHLHFQSRTGHLDRSSFNQLPHSVAREVMAAWLRGRGLHGFDSKTLERLVVAAKTAAPGKRFPVINHANMYVRQDHLALHVPER